MDQFDVVVGRLDRLINKTKLDELGIVLLIVVGSFVALWYGKITGSEWVALSGLVFAAWRGEVAFRQAGAVKGALSTAAAMVAGLVPRPSTPPPPPPADASGPGG
jgi:hypothetical protein